MLKPDLLIFIRLYHEPRPFPPLTPTPLTPSLQVWFTHLPPILVLELSRFKFNQQHNQAEKIHDHFTFDRELFMDRYPSTSLVPRLSLLRRGKSLRTEEGTKGRRERKESGNETIT